MSPEIVEALCSLAARFQDQAEMSMAELFGRSGFAVTDEISDEPLETYLRNHPELVNAWLIESKNTRQNPAWYIFPPKDGSEWVVTHYPDNSKHTFTDKFKACAFYVRVYVKQLASRQSASYYGRVPKWQGET
ncbi:MAG TPA: hypothetical protein VFU86_13810 [Terriglobales bacterium]|nr:hypothetical protein [Terriglobales bacterium]